MPLPLFLIGLIVQKCRDLLEKVVVIRQKPWIKDLGFFEHRRNRSGPDQGDDKFLLCDTAENSKGKQREENGTEVMQKQKECM